MNLNTIRRMAGVEEVFSGEKANYTPVTEADVSLDDVNELTGKSTERFILVHDAIGENSTVADMISILDGPSFANVFIGAHSGTNDAKVAAKEGWTLYHFNQKNRAIADVNARLKQAGIDTVVTESNIMEDCGMPHGENEEDKLGPAPDPDAMEKTVDCRICGWEGAKDEYYDHMQDDHPEVVRGPHDEDEEMGYEDEEAMNYKTSLNKGQHVEYNGQPHIVVVPDAQGDFVGIAPVGQENDPDAINLVHAREIMSGEEEEVVMDIRMEGKEAEKECKWCGNKFAEDKIKDHEETCDYIIPKDLTKKDVKEAEDATVWTKAMDDKDESPESPHRDDSKITVPPKVKTALKKEIKELFAASKKTMVIDKARAEFYEDCAEALQVLLDCLDGTIDGLKRAQIHMTKLMSPIVQRIPDVAYDFVTRGGEPTTLKALFQKVKMEKK